MPGVPAAPPPPDANQPIWETEIAENVTIWKTLAKDKYRLDDDDLRGHVHDREFNRDGTMVLLYLERKVQAIAWEKYDGPTEYWIRLKVELDDHMKRYRNSKGFRFPHDYQRGRLYDLHKERPPLPPGQVLSQDPYVGDSVVLAKAKVRLPAWLWTRSNNALDVAFGPPVPGADMRLREDAMQTFVHPYSAGYIPRPEDRPPRPTTRNLRRVLNDAPRAPEKGSPLWGTPVEGVVLMHLNDDSDGFYEWSGAYLERVFAELCTLVAQYGLGEWTSARWLVFDKYSQCLHRGLQYDVAQKRWIDDAKVWLHEDRYALGTMAMHTGVRDMCPSGRRFNALLPFPPP